jgi:hypothetical protein
VRAGGEGRGRFAPLALLVVSVGLLAVAPLFTSEGYSVLEHTTSESAGQLVQASWIARTGFLCFGFAVLWLAQLRSRTWGGASTLAHCIFAVSMIATAEFSSRSFDASAPTTAPRTYCTRSPRSV